MSREEASGALDIGRPLAAFHLDKLVEAGVLEARFERRTGRTGPGAGRPSKLYRPIGGEVSASVPDRHYDLAGSLLASAVATATRTGAPVADCVRETARAAGAMLGADARTKSDRDRRWRGAAGLRRRRPRRGATNRKPARPVMSSWPTARSTASPNSSASSSAA